MRFSGRRNDGVKGNTASKVGGAVAIFVGILFSVLAALSCNTGDMAGFDGDYRQPECSMQCGYVLSFFRVKVFYCLLNTFIKH